MLNRRISVQESTNWPARSDLPELLDPYARHRRRRLRSARRLRLHAGGRAFLSPAPTGSGRGFAASAGGSDIGPRLSSGNTTCRKSMSGNLSSPSRTGHVHSCRISDAAGAIVTDMADINLVVLNLGNSRLAIGVFSAGQLGQVWRIPHNLRKDWQGAIAEAWAQSSPRRALRLSPLP